MFRWLASLFEWSPEAARDRLLEGRVPSKMSVKGTLNLAGYTGLRALPTNLTAEAVDVSDCTDLINMPIALKCRDLLLRRTRIEALPPELDVWRRIDAQDCRRLRSLYRIRVQELNLRGCIALQNLPDDLMVRRLDVSHCPRLRELPAKLAKHVIDLNVSHCSGLTSLPEDLVHLETLDISGCTGLTSLPENIRVRSWIDLAGCSIKELPWSLRSVRILWRGIPVSDRIAFNPETITVDEILEESNQTRRQILLERAGLAWFIEHSHAVVLDRDSDNGGERQLLQLPFDRGEEVVCVQVHCPSTGNQYVLRVPPSMRTCRQAVAWTAGFDDPDEYQPDIET